MVKKLLICFLLSTYCLVLTASAKTAVDISVVSLGARSVALGRAGVALSGSTNSVFVNPAALARTENYALTSMSAQLLGLVDYRFASGNFKLGKGVLGVSYVSAATPAGYHTTTENSLASAAPINYGLNVLALTYGLKLNDLIRVNDRLGVLSLGANFKYHQQGFSGSILSNAHGSGYSGDLGLILEVSPALSLGLNLQNALAGTINWQTQTSEDLAAATRLGGALKLADGKIMLAADAGVANGQPVALHGGVEWRLLSLLVLRAGFDQGLTTGVGIKLQGLEVDLAYRQDANVSDNSTFFLSLSYAPTVLDQIAIDLRPQAGNLAAQNAILNYYK